MRRSLLWPGGLLIVLMVIFVLPLRAQDSVNAQLEPSGSSTVRGTAVLNPEGPGTRVTLAVSGLAAGTSARASMFAGNCDMSGASSADLPPLTAGQDGVAQASGPILFHGSEPVDFGDIVDGAHSLAIATDAGMVACGLIPQFGANSSVPNDTNATTDETSWRATVLPLIIASLVGAASIGVWWSRRRRVGIIVLLGVLASLIPHAATLAAPGERCFDETGLCISGPIRDYWERNGGLPVFDYPISAQQTETVEGTWTGPVQWFERDRLEDHSNEGKGILAGRLGARWLELNGRPWQTLPGASGPGDPNQCTFFSETGHILCGRFRTYWQQNGGLERFGYPISEIFNETVEGREYAVQYFERRRMEYHPENAGTPYEVLLGLLGRDVRDHENGSGWFFTPAPAQPPLAPPIFSKGAAQRFEHGFMLWTENADAFFLFVDGGRYWIAPAPYTFQEAPPFNATPPPGLYAPTSGFGRLWRGELANLGPSPVPDLPRNLVGWAVEPEHTYSTGYQCQSAPSYSAQRCYMNGPDGEIIWYGPNGWGRWPE